MPSLMLIKLREEGLEPPEKSQLTNYLKQIRSEKSITRGNSINLTQLKQWADERRTIPESMDKVFVANFEYIALPTKKFKIFLTTKRLLSLTQKVKY